MKFILFVIGSLLFMTAAAQQPGTLTPQSSPNTLTAEEKKAGWILLFDGTDTKGWHRFGFPDAGTEWIVQGGTIALDKSVKNEYGDLVTDSAYSDFDLKVEWKISSGGNSGILFYVQEDTARNEFPFYTGPEMQVLDNDRNSDGKSYKHRAGDLYDLIASSSKPVHPAGEWNQAEIYSKGGQLQLFLNGVKVVETTMWNDHWRQMIAHSKFNQWKDFGVAHTGKISLQDHNFPVWFRNIKIKKL